MNTRLSLSFSILFILFSSVVSAQYIQVDDNYTAQQLVEDVLINSSCAQVSNISVSGAALGSGNSYGFFNGAGTTFPFASGIVLSTGRAVGAEGPNTSLLDDGGGGSWGGDPDLEQALSINNSVNATVLEFDFVPLGSKISFDYMLSSEEYHDNAPCQYSDGFAFLLKEVNSPEPYDNLAVVPGTFIPVKVTSVHPEIPNGCEAQNEQYFDAFNGSQHPTNFNGQTVVMKAQANVTPGVLYHIKLVIADEGNYRYDSAIFIGAGSFDVITDLGPDRLLVTGNPACRDEQVQLIDASPNAASYPHRWYKNGSLINGANGTSLTVTTPGTYSVEVQLTASCVSQGEVTIEYANPPAAGTHTLLQCDDNNDGLTVFNLHLADDLVTGSNPDFTTGYYLTQANAEAGTNPISNDQNFENTTVNQQVYARVTNQYGCHAVSTVSLATSANGLTNPGPLETCDTDGTDDGISVFDLTTKDAEILQGLPAGLQLQYFTTALNAFTATNPISNPAAYTNTTANNQTVYARVFNGSECYGIAELELIVHSFGRGFDDEEVIICDGQPALLSVAAGYQYSWADFPAQNTNVVQVFQSGTYTVTITDINDCSTTKTFTVIPSGPAVNAVVNVNDFAGNLNSITIFPEGLGDYEYSLDGNTYFNNPSFTNLVPGEYTFYIKDKNGCGPVYRDVVYVLDYPKFFTPNGDGINDIWRIPYMDRYPDINVNVYDRYGKVVAGFKGNSTGWDGTLDGKALPATDYWFVIQMYNGKIIRGHFAVIR